MRQSEDRPAAGAAEAATGGAAVVTSALGQLREAVDTLAGVEVDGLPEDALTAAVRDLAAVDGRLDGLQARFTRAAEAAGVPERSGATSTTDWVSETTGRSKRKAARTSRMAATAADTPQLVDRLATGEIGPDQADAVARGLDRGTLEPQDATDLLDNAAHLPPGSFDREAKRLAGRRHQRRLREQEDAAHRARGGARWRQDDGTLKLEANVGPADGDLVERAFEAFTTPDPAEVPDHLRRTGRQLMADALVDICRVALAAGPHSEVAGHPPRIAVMVETDMAAAPADAERAGATGTTDLDTVLSAHAVKQLECDATYQRVVLNAQGQVLNVGRATRKWPPAIRTAITALDGRDRTPGSDLPPGRCQIHHVHWWTNGGETSVDNGVLLGPRGHDMIHKEGWTLQLDPTTRICTWTSPDGETTVTTHPHGTAARGHGAPHDIPALRTPPPTPTTPTTPTSSASRGARATGPPGRGDPARPPGPGPDPPDPADRAPPASHTEPLQLDL